MRRHILVLVAVVLALPASVRTQEATILSAMQDELKRSMDGLRIEGQPAPYYIAYQIDETSDRRLVSRLGETIDDTASRDRILRVEVRVGDYAFDSSRFVSPGSTGDAAVAAPIDADYDVMRRQIWLLSDAAYKRAVNIFAKKKAAFQNRSGVDALPDFSREAPVERVLPVAAAPSPAAGEWAERGRQISGVFLSAPQIQTSEVTILEERGRRYYVNSEGFKTVTPIALAVVRVTADTQTAEGADVRDSFEVVERSLSDFPPLANLVARTRELASRVTALRTANTGDDYTGPVLLERSASAQLIAQTLAPALLAIRGPDADNQGRGRGAGAASPFLSRIGSRVMADGLSVVDTPSLTEFGGHPVAGAYVLDDEGIAAKDVTLVENGRLVTLLTGRVPQRNLPRSNGHSRGGAVQPGVLQVKSASATAASELRKSYLALLKTQSRPFGYIVRSLGAGGILQVVKVTPEGAEEVVRGMRFGAVAPNIFRDVLGASEERVLHTYRASPSVQPVPGSLGGSAVTVSIIAPDFIVDDMEVQRAREVAQRKPPIVPSPLAH